MVLRIVSVFFVSLAESGRENKQAKGMELLLLPRYTSIAAGDCVPTTMFAIKSYSVFIVVLLLF